MALPLLIRRGFGGLKGDVKMLNWYVNRCMAGELKPERDGELLSRCQSSAIGPSGWSSPGQLLPLRIVKGAPCHITAVDFHVSPWMCRNVAQQVMHTCLDRDYTEEDIKQLMWDHRSSVNVRKPNKTGPSRFWNDVKEAIHAESVKYLRRLLYRCDYSTANGRELRQTCDR